MNAIRIFVLLFALTCAADAQVPMTGAGLGSGLGAGIILSAVSIAEAAANNSAVGSASIPGSVTGLPSYSLTDASGTFQIDSSTGTITVLSNADLGSFASFSVTISVSGVTPTVPDLATTIWVVATAPTLAIDPASDSSGGSNVTNVTSPTIDFTATLYTGDIVQFYLSSVAYGSPHTVTSGEVSAGAISLGFAALTDGAKSLTATISRGGYTSAASSACTFTIDTVAPVLSSPSGTKTGSSTANLSVATDTTAGTLYWVVTTTNTPPTAAQVKAGQNAAGTTAAANGSAAVSASPVTPSATGLTSATVYYEYFMQEDVAGNQSAVVSGASFTTDAASYDAAASAIFAAFTTPPVTARKDLINAFVLALKTGATSGTNIWAKGDTIKMYAAADSQAALINWKAPGTADSTLSGSPTFATDRGFTTNGTSNFINDVYNLASGGGNYAQNSASLGFWGLDTTKADASAGGWYDGTDGSTIGPCNASGPGAISFRVNQSTASGMALGTAANTNYFALANRSGATSLQYYENGSAITITTAPNQASVAVNSHDVQLGSVTGASFVAHQYAFSWVGGSLNAAETLDLYNAVYDYLHSAGAV